MLKFNNLRVGVFTQLRRSIHSKVTSMRYHQLTLILCFCLFICRSILAQTVDTNRNNELNIVRSQDFELTGNGSSQLWKQAKWVELPQRMSEGKSYKTVAKLMYSNSGIYCLFQCEDEKITSTLTEDFADLWTEDVVEIFFWPDESLPVYFEYELSPRNYELPIMVPNRDGYFFGWRPWKYEGDKLTRHKTSISEKADDSTWIAEFFIPYTLLKPLVDGAPESGTKWRMNMYRLDYDNGQSRWAWQTIRTNFHDYESYGTMVFE